MRSYILLALTIVSASIVISISYSVSNNIKVRFSSNSIFSSYRNHDNSYRLDTSLKMSDDPKSLLDQMKRALGEKEDMFEDAEKESKQLLQGLRDLDRDPNLKANNKFIDWLASNGVWVQSKSSWGKAPHPLVISSNTEDDGESCGRGLLARESLTEGELMMTIPFDICLTRAAAREIFGPAIIPEYMDEYISIALLLMNERLIGTKSNWKPYLDVLPTKEDVNPSFVWTDEELESLKGSPVYMASKFLNQKVRKEYDDLKETIFKRYPNIFPQEKFTYELFEWAFVMLFSRAARLSSKSGGEELALVPYADLMNHNPYSNTYIDAQKQGIPLISKEEEVAVYSDRSYRKFEQVFINYGEKSNADLLLLYGFALERNPFNSIDIVVGLSKDDPLYNQKKAYLDRQGRGEASVRFPLQQDRYPSELVDFLRLLLVEPEDLGLQTIANVDFNEPISPSLERRVLSTMISICETYLEQYPSTVQDDEILIKDRKMFDLLTRQQRMAVKLRASEKRILLSTITAVKEELLRLPAVVNVGEEILPAGRSFDTMGPRVPLSLNNYKSLVEDRDAKKKQLEEAAKQKEGSASIAERRRRRRG